MASIPCVVSYPIKSLQGQKTENFLLAIVDLQWTGKSFVVMNFIIRNS